MCDSGGAEDVEKTPVVACIPAARAAEGSLEAFFVGEPELYSLNDVKVEEVYGMRERK